MTPHGTGDLRTISEYIQCNSGIALPKNKAYLLEQRLQPLLEELGCASLGALTHRATVDSSGDLRRRILDAISTQETSFYRDPRTYRWLQDRWAPTALKANRMRYSIWSAACSTGQEAFSLAMDLCSNLHPADLPRFTVIGTDLSQPALAQARTASYSDTEIARGLPADKKKRFFEPKDGRWYLKDPPKRLVTFRRQNLLRDWKTIGTMDVILVRNILIYFDLGTRQRILRGMAKHLRHDGVLLLGSTELMPPDVPLKRQEQDGVVYFVPA